MTVALQQCSNEKHHSASFKVLHTAMKPSFLAMKKLNIPIYNYKIQTNTTDYTLCFIKKKHGSKFVIITLEKPV